MKITRNQLKRIIREEIEAGGELDEAGFFDKLKGAFGGKKSEEEGGSKMKPSEWTKNKQLATKTFDQFIGVAKKAASSGDLGQYAEAARDLYSTLDSDGLKIVGRGNDRALELAKEQLMSSISFYNKSKKAAAAVADSLEVLKKAVTDAGKSEDDVKSGYASVFDSYKRRGRVIR
jgi:hypothetical protein